MAELIHGFGEGDRVRHSDWGSVGTVRFHIETDEPTAYLTAEVTWDNTSVSDELDERLAANLVRI